MKEVLKKLRKSNIAEDSGKVIWKSPSNIALIKYWGKFGKQLPANPSLSFSLQNSVTQTSLTYKPKKQNDIISLEFKFEGKTNESFAKRIENYLSSIQPLFPLLSTHHLIIESENSFPHSSGIASSASAMSAIALCLVDIQNQLARNPLNEENSLRLASYIARLGSGSAGRSVFGGYSIWGKTRSIKGSSDLYAIQYPYEINSEFKNLHDDILIVEKGKKEVSSSAGHNLMIEHPFAKRRFKIANNNLSELKNILSNGDIELFGQLVEKEALMLHAMMMTSDPYFILIKPNTLSIINKIWEFRKQEKTPIFFTLDAGANVHLIYRDEDKEKVSLLIDAELLVYCENGQYLCDQIGKGPERLKS